MFLVKNIRGVIPTLSGDVHKLQGITWLISRLLESCTF
jgi:hypothetical protein